MDPVAAQHNCLHSFAGRAVSSHPWTDACGPTPQSVFCACPPGQAQWTTRFFRALHQGCIPLTFWVNSDMPYKDLGLDFSEFTVNVAPPQISAVNHILLALVADQPRLLRLQQALEAAQRYFSWSPDIAGNAPASITAVLRAKGAKLAQTAARCSQPQQRVLKQLAEQEALFQANVTGGNPFMAWHWVQT